MRRVAVIGLDAAEPHLIERMIADGELPTLARLRQAGARCELTSEATWRSGRVAHQREVAGGLAEAVRSRLEISGNPAGHQTGDRV